MSSNNMNPFYIEPDDAWQYDTEDLQDLLGNDAWDHENQSPRSGRRSHDDFGGRRRSYDDDFGHPDDSVLTQRTSMVVGLVVVVVLVIVTTTASGGSLSSSSTRFDTEPISTICVLGERNSGQEWLVQLLQTCFPTLEVSAKLQRRGYFFQDPVPLVAPTLVVAVFRNPYDWVQSMRQHPQFAPRHNSTLTWETFVTLPWTMERPQADLALEAGAATCQEGFAYDHVVSCVESSAIYELKEDGTPYSSIVDLRAAKIYNFLEPRGNVTQTLVMQYENLVKDGLQHLLRQINQTVGVPYECNVESNGFELPTSSDEIMKQDYLDWMNAHVDWKAEAMVGYEKWDALPDNGNSRDDSDEEQHGKSGSDDSKGADSDSGEKEKDAKKKKGGDGSSTKDRSENNEDNSPDEKNKPTEAPADNDDNSNQKKGDVEGKDEGSKDESSDGDESSKEESEESGKKDTSDLKKGSSTNEPDTKDTKKNDKDKSKKDKPKAKATKEEDHKKKDTDGDEETETSDRSKSGGSADETETTDADNESKGNHKDKKETKKDKDNSLKKKAAEKDKTKVKDEAKSSKGDDSEK